MIKTEGSAMFLDRSNETTNIHHHPKNPPPPNATQRILTPPTNTHLQPKVNPGQKVFYRKNIKVKKLVKNFIN